MFAPVPVLETEVFATIPASLRRPGYSSEWTEVMRQGAPTDCFIEGPSFDREGKLYFCDIPFGRIFKVTPDGTVSLAAEYDGEPCALKFHKDGRAFITDYKHGVIELDFSTGAVKPYVDRYLLQRFRGVNDLAFADNGDLYFTDQGQSDVHDPSGRLFRLSANGRLDLLLDNVPSPNGLVLNPEQDALYLAVTRTNSVWRFPILKEDRVAKVGVFLQLSGSLAGPDGLAIDEQGNLAIAHPGLGAWIFNRFGEPLFRIKSPSGRAHTNLAYGWPDRHYLYLTESDTGNVVRVRMPVPGRVMYSHQS